LRSGGCVLVFRRPYTDFVHAPYFPSTENASSALPGSVP